MNAVKMTTEVFPQTTCYKGWTNHAYIKAFMNLKYTLISLTNCTKFYLISTLSRCHYKK